ncbi:1,4-dihydroxy-2-naphthoate polyprenyltransferase [Sediminibacillus dalangtanensis]|uniref:1,4-dihydroxy-2-naphthoate octaprenyltransferase n=1 Tax=Sediminibacillus dalangtanensis TaxID=2729421 RepID=A0ABX7W043_9BACI|nr:1,4-dihydroxy-2-naphthoate polyprenyltransferase [Sediminibacillus dalangtanensis]QTN00168.1 1,4-dihydroxy-2-naphthoate polyprenyltransferase [Sediminibacillus dalangtanensis]
MQSLDKNAISSALNEKAGFQVWWRLLRPHTLTASFVPVFVGTMAAMLDASVNFWLFAAMLLASMLIQAATNMFNEYYDFVRGLDNEKSVGIGGTIVRDGVAPQTVLRLALSFFAVAILLGVYICLESSWWIAGIGIISMLCGYLYTGGPYPIAYTPFGELIAGFFMGTVIIGISYFIQTMEVTGAVVWISIPVAILIGTIMLSNNIRDLEGDKENGRKTIAILVGRKNAVILLAALFAVSYILMAIYVLTGILPIWSFITLLGTKKAVSAVKGFKGKTVNLEMMPAMKATAQTNTFFGLLLGLSLLIEYFIPFHL